MGDEHDVFLGAGAQPGAEQRGAALDSWEGWRVDAALLSFDVRTLLERPLTLSRWGIEKRAYDQTVEIVTRENKKKKKE